MLEEITGEAVTGLSYPHGSTDRHTRTLVHDAALAFACGSSPHVFLPGADLYNLPRLWVANMDGTAFRKWLRWWL
jgi:hypothetical protein